jgi:hypothetical protein
MIERDACSKADLPNWVIYLESVKVGSKATESPGGKSLRGGGGSKRNRQRESGAGRQKRAKVTEVTQVDDFEP